MTAEVTCRAGRGHWSIRGYLQQRPGQGDCRGHLQGWTGSLVYQRLSAAEARSGRLQRSPAGLDGVTGLPEVICSRGQVRATAEVTCRAGRGHWSIRGYPQQRPGQGDCRGHLQGWTGSLVYQRLSAAEARSGRLQRSPAGLDGVTGLSEVIRSRGQVRATAEVTCRAGRGHWSTRGYLQQRPGQGDCRGHLQGWTGSLSTGGICSRGKVRVAAEITWRKEFLPSAPRVPRSGMILKKARGLSRFALKTMRVSPTKEVPWPVSSECRRIDALHGQ